VQINKKHSTVTIKHDVMQRLGGHTIYFHECLTEADLIKCKKLIAMMCCVSPYACRSKSGGGSIKRGITERLSRGMNLAVVRPMTVQVTNWCFRMVKLIEA
jgi:hypothetical protein